MLCQFGCGQESTAFNHLGIGRCLPTWQQCPVKNKQMSLITTMKMKDPAVRKHLSELTIIQMNKVDPATGLKQGVINGRKSAVTRTTCTDIHGATISKLSAQKALKTKRDTIDEVSGKNILEQHGEFITRWNATEVEPGISRAKKNGLKGGETRKGSIAQDIARKRHQTQLGNIDSQGLNGAQRRAQKAADTKKIKIDKTTGLTVAETAKIKDRQFKLSSIDEKGRNGYERSAMAAFKVVRLDDTDLFYQGTYELKFLESQIAMGVKIEDITRGPCFNYVDPNTGKDRSYVSDFLIGNTVYEIKSSYYMKLGGINVLKAKLQSAKDAGFNSKLILDHEYYDWEKL